MLSPDYFNFNITATTAVKMTGVKMAEAEMTASKKPLMARKRMKSNCGVLK